MLTQQIVNPIQNIESCPTLKEAHWRYFYSAHMFCVFNNVTALEDCTQICHTDRRKNCSGVAFRTIEPKCGICGNSSDGIGFFIFTQLAFTN